MESKDVLLPGIPETYSPESYSALDTLRAIALLDKAIEQAKAQGMSSNGD